MTPANVVTERRDRLDRVDRAFCRRWFDPQPSAVAGASGEPPPAPPPGAASPAGVPPVPRPPAAPARAPATIVERLLSVVPDTWIGLAQRIEERARAGACVFAVAGAGPAEGRSTLVLCLARALAARGTPVDVAPRAPVEIPVARPGRPAPVVLVDAGVWFPAGPLRRDRLERQSLGCHAVILVRRADSPACPHRGPACAAVGLDVIGEVVTMVPRPATPTEAAR